MSLGKRKNYNCFSNGANVISFFALVRAGLWEENVNLTTSKEIDYVNVCRFADEQSVVGLIAAGLEHVDGLKIPQEIALQFAGQALQIERRNKAMNLFINRLISILRECDVYTLLVKGQGVAQCYERPLWRASGDIDLFLSEVNYKKAKSILIPKASSIEEEDVVCKHLGMTIGDWIVELHGMLYCALSFRIRRVLKEIMRETLYGGIVRSWQNENIQVFLLGAANEALYIFTHYIGHFYGGGVGLRQICDWCRLLWTYRDTIDVALLEKRLNSMGLTTEWKAFGAFAVEYLGMPKEAMPLYDSDDKWKRKAVKICSFIMKVGNFGQNRDMTYYGKYPLLIRKTISFIRRCCDLWNHVKIFPFDSLRFFSNIVFNGIRSVTHD